MMNFPQDKDKSHHLQILCILCFNVVPLMVIFGTVDGDLVPLMVKMVPLMVFEIKKWYR